MTRRLFAFTLLLTAFSTTAIAQDPESMKSVGSCFVLNK